MFITITVTFPCFGIAAITASVARRCANFVLVQTVGRLFEAIDAQHTGRIDAAFAATVERFTRFEYTITNRRQILFDFDFLHNGVWIVAKNEFFQCIDDRTLCARLIECTSTCKNVNGKLIKFHIFTLQTRRISARVVCLHISRDKRRSAWAIIKKI